MPIAIFRTGIALFLLFLLRGKCSATGQVLLHESHTFGLSLTSKLLALLGGHLADQPRCHLEGLSVSIRNRAGILDRIWAGRLDRNDDRVHLANSTCRAARVIFGHLQVLRPSDSEYSKRVNENWYASFPNLRSQLTNMGHDSRSKNCHLPAACIIEPRTSADVAITLKIIQLFEPQFSVRSGGQNPNPGFGSIDQRGVLIDLRQFNGTKISGDRETVTVGAGARWGDVYKYLDPYNVSAVGSRSPVPAVGGFLAGGGENVQSLSIMSCRLNLCAT